MRFSSASVLCAAPFLVSAGPMQVASYAITTELPVEDIASFIAAEKPIALQGVLNNIGPNGKLVPSAASGLVIASPSKLNPDCKSVLLRRMYTY